MSVETTLREKLSTCTRIFAMQQLIGLFGHISAFDPESGRVYFSPGMGSDKASIAPDNILVGDLNGPVAAGGQRLPAEWPIHTALHGRRKDALAVAHLHSPFATLFAVQDTAFRPLTLQGSVFAGGMPLFTEPHLVTTPAQGERLAELVGERPGAFMRGHGIVVVARDVEQMLFAALILEDEAKKAVQAAPLGHLHCLSDADCQAFGGIKEFPGRAQRCWNYYAALEKRWDKTPGTGCVPFV
jgi:ribulose-5-phosphate 4-epimerase/fuculose-1-phosphate aldolase